MNNRKMINEILEELSALEENDINSNLSLRGDLMFDSIYMVELVVSLEEKFGIEFNIGEISMETLNSVGDLYKMVDRYVQ